MVLSTAASSSDAQQVEPVAAHAAVASLLSEVAQVIRHQSWSESHGQLLEWMIVGSGVTLLLGAPGSGKTLLLQDLAATLERRGLPTLLLPPGTQFDPTNLAGCVLIDDADRIAPDIQLTLLPRANLTLVLAGRPALAEVMAGRFGIRRADLAPLSPNDARMFVAARASQSGHSADYLTGGVAELIVNYAAGNARVLDAVTGLSMLVASFDSAMQVTVGHVHRAIEFRDRDAAPGQILLHREVKLPELGDDELAAWEPTPMPAARVTRAPPPVQAAARAASVETPPLSPVAIPAAPLDAALPFDSEIRTRSRLMPALVALALLCVGTSAALWFAQQAAPPDWFVFGRTESSVATVLPGPHHTGLHTTGPLESAAVPRPDADGVPRANAAPGLAAEQSPGSSAARRQNLPAAALTRIVVSYARGDLEAARQGVDLARELRTALSADGATISEPVPIARRIAQSGIQYFFVQDGKRAAEIGQRLDGRFGAGVLAPLSPHDSLPRPGTIEILLSSE